MRTSRSAVARSLHSFLLLTLSCMAGITQAMEEIPSIRLAIISLAPPSKIYKQWKPFADYLSNKTGREVKLIVPKGFEKIKRAVEEKSIDVFYVNSHIFYHLKMAGQAHAVAQMVNLDGSTTSKGVLFARSDSNIKNLVDLKGEKIAFLGPMAAGGYLAPRAELYLHGIKTNTEAIEQFTQNLSTSIHKVLIGDVKAGAMCGLNFRLMEQRLETGDLKIIAETAEYPENVFGIRSDLEPQLRKQLSAVIITMSASDAGKKILEDMQSMKILRFVAYDDKIEDITRTLLNNAEF